MTKLRQQL